MADLVEKDAPDSVAIRRRLAREYVLLTAPSTFDTAAALNLLDGLTGNTDNADIVIDVRAVERSEPAVVRILSGAARALALAGIALTVSHPSPVFEEVLAVSPPDERLSIRRARAPRPLRHSMRGQVGDV